jgi:hypothetical protein
MRVVRRPLTLPALVPQILNSKEVLEATKNIFSYIVCV